MGNAIAVTGDNRCLGPTVAGNNFRDGIRAGLKAQIIEFTPRQIAKVTGRDRECAKHWVDPEDKRIPNTESTILLARGLPGVQHWLAVESGMGNRAAQCASISEIIRGLHSIAARDDDEGRVARQLLVASYAIRTGSDDKIPPIVGVAWNEIDKKVRGA